MALPLLVVQALHVLVAAPSASHLRYMSFFDPPPLSSLAGGWINLLHSESVTEAAATFDAAGVPFLVALTIDGGTGADPAVAAGQGASLLCGAQPVTLCPRWRQRLGTVGDRLRPHMARGAVVGVFIGDELLSGHQELGYINLVNLSTALRAELGPMALLYANMEATWMCNPCPGRGCFPRVPASWDLVSGDDYWNAAHTNTYTSGFEATKQVYLKCLLPKLAPHQRALLVPGVFAAPAFLAQNDTAVAEQLQKYYDFARTNSHIAGFNPWHYYNRSGTGGYAAGAEAMPHTLALLHQIGKAITSVNFSTA